MWFAYIDESKDDNGLFIYTALVMDGEKWSPAFQRVKAFRRHLHEKYGIHMALELHAWKFAAGKGKVAGRPILKPERAEIFREVMRFIAECKCFVVVSSCHKVEQYAFERLMNRINRTAQAKEKNVLLFFDQGEEAEITKRIRRMRVHNPIPSRFGTWLDSDATTKSIPLERCVEDPIFKDSKASYFIQLADFCAYALLRMERPIESRTKLGYDTMYEELRPVSRRLTNPSDPKGMGIIR
ncbi:DUF3800 domain-containing protein [Sphingobium xenophagum]|uniref:DUF3800 domain-containing protein n=1 Tax=Sphingobium xenophagum TaxID=121428 RepID=UPI0003767113|nr:DUF3800 domain-containing protein [Sphingobium xenophagum]